MILALRKQLHYKCTLVQERSGYPRDKSPTGISISVLRHLTMECAIHIIARQNFVLWVSYDAMLPYGSIGN